MDNNNLNETPMQDVQATVEQAEEVTYKYTFTDEDSQEIEEIPAKGFSIAGLILGIASILCCALPCLDFILGVVGLILSIVGRKRNGDGLSLAGLITSIIGGVLAVLGIFLVSLYFILAIISMYN